MTKDEVENWLVENGFTMQLANELYLKRVKFPLSTKPGAVNHAYAEMRARLLKLRLRLEVFFPESGWQRVGGAYYQQIAISKHTGYLDGVGFHSRPICKLFADEPAL